MENYSERDIIDSNDLNNVPDSKGWV